MSDSPVSLDSITFKDGDFIELLSGREYVLSKGIDITANNVTIGARNKIGPLPILRFTGDKDQWGYALNSIFHVPANISGTVFQNLILDTPKNVYLVQDDGKNLVMDHVGVNAGGGLAEFRNADGAILNDCWTDPATTQRYSVYIGGYSSDADKKAGIWRHSSNICLYYCRLGPSSGESTLRAQDGFVNLLCEHCTFNGSGGTKLNAARVHDGTNAIFRWCMFLAGNFTGGPLDGADGGINYPPGVERDQAATRALDGLTLESCYFGPRTSWITFAPGLKNLKMNNCVGAGSFSGSMINVHSQYMNRPAPQGEIANSIFDYPGGALLSGEKTLKFTNTSFNGRPVKADGTF